MCCGVGAEGGEGGCKEPTEIRKEDILELHFFKDQLIKD